MVFHPSNELLCTKSEKLKDRKIALCVTGSIAAVETVKLARELIRHGAEIFPVMTREAQKIISPHALQFATGNMPITEITGNIEHVSLCGKTQNKVDLLLIAPCTANTISKIACGIDDTPVTTFATTALGTKIPIMIVPAMHGSMYNNSIVLENIEKLKRVGIEFIEPKLEEGKAKFPETDEIVERVIRKLGRNDMNQLKLLVIAGSTTEQIDDVRAITNKSSGKTGIELAKRAFERGAEVKLLYGSCSEKIPSYIRERSERIYEEYSCAKQTNIRGIAKSNSEVSPKAVPKYVQSENFCTVNELIAKLKNLNYYNAIICPAAISDYIPERKNGKLSSEKKEISLKLKQAPKILKLIRKKYRNYIVGFKLESNISREELLKRAYSKLKSENLNLIVANDLKNLTLETNEVLIIDRKMGFILIKDRKEKIAERILDKVADDLYSATENESVKISRRKSMLQSIYLVKKK